MKTNGGGGADDGTARPERQVPAVSRAIDILGLFLDGKGPRSVPEITAELGLPRSSAYELVQTLVAKRCLRPVDENVHRYQLGLHLFELGSSYIEGIDLAEQGGEVAREVVARCDETVHVAMLDGADVVYVVKADSSQAVRMVSAVGRRLPAHCTAVGKVLLAGLRDEEVARRYEQVTQWVRMTPGTIAGLDELLRELDVIRERGLAFDEFESNVDVRCVAAPVRDASGAVVAGLSISVPGQRSDQIDGELARLAAEAGRALSARLGHRDPGDVRTAAGGSNSW
ncbi:IclR family transcriptional regulator [Phytoactinopolyspora alkaliphila]|uniref:IclR family transcriptional regulator n=1 Tax=Phytoactinopolyspora alkaliphila TaxID=1783498 RepID=UPI001C207734